MEDHEIDKRVNYHPPTEAAKALHQMVRVRTREFIEALDDLPEGREKALVMTKIEEAMFWANAAIARNHEKLG